MTRADIELSVSEIAAQLLTNPPPGTSRYRAVCIRDCCTTSHKPTSRCTQIQRCLYQRLLHNSHKPTSRYIQIQSCLYQRLLHNFSQIHLQVHLDIEVSVSEIAAQLLTNPPPGTPRYRGVCIRDCCTAPHKSTSRYTQIQSCLYQELLHNFSQTHLQVHLDIELSVSEIAEKFQNQRWSLLCTRTKLFLNDGVVQKKNERWTNDLDR